MSYSLFLDPGQKVCGNGFHAGRRDAQPVESLDFGILDRSLCKFTPSARPNRQWCEKARFRPKGRQSCQAHVPVN